MRRSFVLFCLCVLLLDGCGGGSAAPVSKAQARERSFFAMDAETG